MENDMQKYESIINMPHHQSRSRPHMPVRDRAAQFAPFAALSGYDDVIEETRRLTEGFEEPSEEQQQKLNELTHVLLERISERPEILVTYFEPDQFKEGGAYDEYSGQLRFIDTAERVFVMAGGKRISMAYITDIRILS